MLVQIIEEKEKREAKKQYQENIGIISDLSDICDVIDELAEKLNNSQFEFKDKFIEDLKARKCDVKAEMEHYENEDLEIKEVWGDF